MGQLTLLIDVQMIAEGFQCAPSLLRTKVLPNSKLVATMYLLIDPFRCSSICLPIGYFSKLSAIAGSTDAECQISDH